MRRRERGLTIIELLVAAFIGSIVLIGVTSFFLSSIRFASAANSQAAVQRAGGDVAEDIGRRLRASNGSPDIEPPTAIDGQCMPLSTNDPVLVVTDQAGVIWCYYRNASTPPQLVRCSKATLDSACLGGSMLTGGLASVTATAWSVSFVTPCQSAGGNCDAGGLCSIAFQSCGTVPGAIVSFELGDGVNEPMRFGLGFVFGRH